MTSSSPEARAETTRIVVDVPHWSAAVALIDNDLQAVGGVGPTAPVYDDPFGGRVAVEVRPGAYEVRVTLDGKTQAKWVVAEASRPTMLPKATWTDLVIDTAMPLPAAAPGPERSDRLARAAALASVAPRRVETEARLTLFATAAAEATRDFDLDVSLLDEAGAVITSVSDPDQRVGIVPGRLWRCAFDLDPGYYILRAPLPPRPREEPGPKRYRYQPLFLCPGVEVHLFFRCDGVPELGTLTLSTARLGEGCEPGRDDTLAVDAVLTALSTGDGERVVLGSERLRQLLEGEQRDPWLAVLSAYALLDAGMRDDAKALLNDVREHLADGPLGDHPDVRTLMLGTPRERLPIDYPPMLRPGLSRVRAAAAERTGIIAEGSPLWRMGDRLIADSAWTSWVDPEPEQPASALAPASEEDGARMPPAIPVFVDAFPDSAPVYPLAEFAEKPEEQAVAEGATLAGHAAIIQAASRALADPDAESAEALSVNLQEDAGNILAMTPAEVSRLTGAPLDLVVEQFAALKSAQPDPALAQGSEEVHRSLDVLAAAIQAAQVEAAASGGLPGQSPAPSSGTPIETMAKRLEADAAQMERAGSETGGEDGRAMATLAERLRALISPLLQQAHVVIVADETGRLRYGNRLLRDRLLQRPEGAAAVIARMRGVLAGLRSDKTVVNAADLSPNSPEAAAGVDVEVRRRALADPDGALLGHVYLLRALWVPSITPDQFRRIDELLPQVTLYASLAEHSSGDARRDRIGRLTETVDEVERLLPR